MSGKRISKPPRIRPPAPLISSQVDDYCRGKEVIGTDQLGALKQAYIIGEREKIAGNDSLQFSQVNLQKLFIKLTEKGGESI